jgi:PmbA protein
MESGTKAGDHPSEGSGERSAFVAASSRDAEQAERLVEEALLAGAEEAEVYLKSSSTTSIVSRGSFATLAGGSERGVALRVFDGKGSIGHAFASWSSADVGTRLISQALASLRASSSPPSVSRLPAPRPASPFPEIREVLEAAVLERSPEEKRAAIEKAMTGADPHAVGRLGVSYRDGVSRVVIANSRGLGASFVRTLAMLTLTLSDEGYPTLHAEAAACGLKPDEIRASVEKLLRLAGSHPEREIHPGFLLLESSSAAPLVRWIERELVADSDPVAGRGRFRRIASEAVEVLDDPLLPGGLASAPFDGEGYPASPRRLVKSGIPVARLEGDKTEGGASGHSVRVSYRDVPAPGGSNLFIVPGRRSGEEILQGVEEGLLLAGLESDSRGSDREREACWRGIGWRIRGGRLEPGCGRFLFRATPRLLLERILEASANVRFSLHGTTALGSPDLLIRLAD